MLIRVGIFQYFFLHSLAEIWYEWVLYFTFFPLKFWNERELFYTIFFSVWLEYWYGWELFCVSFNEFLENILQLSTKMWQQGCGQIFVKNIQVVDGFCKDFYGADGNIFLQKEISFKGRVETFFYKKDFCPKRHTAGPSTIVRIWCGLIMYDLPIFLAYDTGNVSER